MKTIRFNQLPSLLLVTILLGGPATQAQTLTWRGTGGDLLWSNPLNWDFNVAPAASDALLFDNIAGFTNGPGLVNNIMDQDTTVSSIQFTAFINNYHTTEIPAGRTLFIAGTDGTLLSVGTSADDGADAQIFTTMTGGGNLAVGDMVAPVASTIVQVGQRSGTGGLHRGTLDLTGLNSFTAGVGSFYVGGNWVSINRDQGTLHLAKTNVILAVSTATAGAIRLAHSPGNQGTGSYLYLGQENSIYTGFMRIGGARSGTDGGVVRFQTGLVNPTLKLRGADMVSRMGTLSLADGFDSAGTTAYNGTLDLTGGTVDGLLSTLTVGRNSSSTGTGSANASMSFDAGTVDATTVNLGGQTGANSTARVTGVLNVSGTASLIVGTLNIGRDAGTNTGFGTGTLNVRGGSVLVTGNVVENNATGGTSGSSTINLTGGTMKVSGSMTLDNLNLTTGTLQSAGAITVANLNLTNNTMILALSSAINATNPVCRTTNLYVQAPVTLKVIGGGFALGQYPLIKYYSGAIGGDGYDGITLGGMPSRAEGYLSNNLAESSIDLVVTNLSAAKWNGNVNGNWDINATTNWTDAQTSAPTTYLEESVPGDTVIFDDTASGTTTVDLTTILSPAVLTVNNSAKTYIFNGPGALSGPATFTKSGSGTLVLTNSGVNDFSGAVAINGGTLRLGLAADRLPVAANVTLADQPGAVLDLGDQDQTLLSLSGGGPAGGNVSLGSGNLATTGSGTYLGVISGSGMFRKLTGGTQTLGGANTYIGGTLINGGTLTLINTNGSAVGSGLVEITNGTLRLGDGGPGGRIAAGIVITNSGTVRFNTSEDITVPNAILGSGAVIKDNTNTVWLTGANTYTGTTTINDGGLRISDAAALGDVAGGTTIPNTPGAHLDLLGDITVWEPFTIAQKQSAYGPVAAIVNVSGTNTLAGQITANTGGSYWPFRADGGKLIVSGFFNHNATSSSRGLRLLGAAEGDWATSLPTAGTATTYLLKEEAGTWTLSAANTYNGETRAYGGVLVVNGQILSSASLIVGDPATNTPARLAGTGFISSPVTVNPNGTLAPGNSIGTLTIYNTLNLSGTAEMEVSPPTADKITGLSGITLGGTLKVTLTGTVTTNDFFTLFEATPGTYSGDFAVYDLPTLPPPLAWDHSTVPVDGTLRVTTEVPRPRIVEFGRASDGSFKLAGTGPDAATYRILATTNIGLPLLEWAEIGSGSFVGWAFSFTDLNATNYPQRFYSVVTP